MSARSGIPMTRPDDLFLDKIVDYVNGLPSSPLMRDIVANFVVRWADDRCEEFSLVEIATGKRYEIVVRKSSEWSS